MLEVSIIYALPAMQREMTLRLPPDSTVKDAIIGSGILMQFGLSLNNLKVGIWGEETSLDTPLKPGDRVEIYRPLLTDPKLLRKQRAKKP